MPNGTVVKISDKGYGFIEAGGQRDIFFHATGMVERSQFEVLVVHDRVSFELLKADDGKVRAVSVALQER